MPFVRKYNLDESELGNLYTKKGLGAMEIAKILNVSYSVVYDSLHRYGIPMRNPSEAQSQVTKNLASKGLKHFNWRGGKTHHLDYVLIALNPKDFFYPMTRKGSNYVREHRLVMAKHLGRNLQRWEIVHHKNGIRDDNRLENLELVSSNGQHIKEHSEGYRRGFEVGYKDGEAKRIQELKKEIEQLKAALRGIQH